MGASALWALLHNNQRVYEHTHTGTKTLNCPNVVLELCIPAGVYVLPDSKRFHWGKREFWDTLALNNAAGISNLSLWLSPKARTSLKCPTIRLGIKEAHARFKKGTHLFTVVSLDMDASFSCLWFGFFFPVNRRPREQAGTDISLPAEVPGKPLPAAKSLIVFFFFVFVSSVLVPVNCDPVKPSFQKNHNSSTFFLTPWTFFRKNIYHFMFVVGAAAPQHLSPTQLKADLPKKLFCFQPLCVFKRLFFFR